MKVLMFGWELPPFNSGGLGVACWGLSRSLADLGVDLVFVLPNSHDISSDKYRILFADNNISMRGVNTLLTPYITSEEYRKKRGRGGLYGHSLMEEVLRYAKLSGDIAREETFDVIHAHDWLSFLSGVEAKRVSGKPLVVHVHATEFDRTGNGKINQFVYDIEREGMQKADRVVAISQYIKDLVIDKYGIDPRKIRVVHNGINEEDYVTETNTPTFIKRLKEDGKKIVLFVGRITLQKGPDYFVKMAEKVRQYYEDVYFVVAGSGDMEGQMIREVNRRGLSDRFIFTGFLRGGDLDTVYAASDVYVMPSVSEPFGITPLEAALHGVPAIISKVSGVKEVLTHSLVSDFWDVDDMADKVISVLENQSLKNTLGNNSAIQIKSINWREAAKKCIDMYTELLRPVVS
ncbi:MAG: hypothetical protein A3E94_01280 [Candidatus Zambryskibacteria bacterium RIFCSPHIGHO2_12_FULL_44_12b]|uniref:4-alpha-glucanotransferase n=1 Tax=Candidatus Zambryskibacteria bacterium RIFCSPLOWO2_01_FULL_45_21 TaxID=1802761 RepID=A0A1G2U1R4_9BACT|nr:MAG: hypothetical protein A3E94_01280 [Candidatus Zambryskibacteria bacterium RIFCSPHIGHO2_12_FULL_44_12b]OHB03465.1 MAG: hypothetical protein A3B14_02960 [Candidatus Zambryskibacteria bacterium RIFCSPLOWO2_01_FULL_45_21]